MHKIKDLINRARTQRAPGERRQEVSGTTYDLNTDNASNARPLSLGPTAKVVRRFSFEIEINPQRARSSAADVEAERHTVVGNVGGGARGSHANTEDKPHEGNAWLSNNRPVEGARFELEDVPFQIEKKSVRPVERVTHTPDMNTLSYEERLAYEENLGVAPLPRKDLLGEVLDLPAQPPKYSVEAPTPTMPMMAREDTHQQIQVPEEEMFPCEDAVPCSICMFLSVSKILQISNGALYKTDIGCRHHLTWRSLVISAENGCRLCTMFKDLLLESTTKNLDAIGNEAALSLMQEKPLTTVYGIGEDSFLTLNLGEKGHVATCKVGLHKDRGMKSHPTRTHVRN